VVEPGKSPIRARRCDSHALRAMGTGVFIYENLRRAFIAVVRRARSLGNLIDKAAACFCDRRGEGVAVKVRITQLDGKLPNLALMRLSAWHKYLGDDVFFTRNPDTDLFDMEYDRVYGSAIFKFSEATVARFIRAFPDAILGGTGTESKLTVEGFAGDFNEYDYSIDPGYKFSLGFTQRGCRLKCGFCVVPKKEGANRSTNTIADIWRGEGHPKKVCLLDNDFFGQPRDQWRARIHELNDGGFRVCFNQGLNVRIIDQEACEAIASVQYRDDQFTCRRLYTAWDNIGDEAIFFKGVDMLEMAGVPPKHLMAFMLIGYDPKETKERIMYRLGKMQDRGILPYPMVFDRSRRELRAFARWVATGLYRAVPFQEYQWGARGANRGWLINDEATA